MALELVEGRIFIAIHIKVERFIGLQRKSLGGNSRFVIFDGAAPKYFPFSCHQIGTNSVSLLGGMLHLSSCFDLGQPRRMPTADNHNCRVVTGMPSFSVDTY